MKKRNIAARLGVVALALTLATTSLSSGTLAKYTTTLTGKGTMKVAGWNVTADLRGSTITATSPTMDLWDTIADTPRDALTTGKLQTTGFVAPGDQGSFLIEINDVDPDNNQLVTDVAYDFDIYFKIGTNAPPENMTFYRGRAQGQSTTVGYDSLAAANTDVYKLTASSSNTNGILIGHGSVEASATLTDDTSKYQVEWVWPYESPLNTVDDKREYDEKDVKIGWGYADENAEDGVHHSTVDDRTVDFQIVIVFTQKSNTSAFST